MKTKSMADLLADNLDLAPALRSLVESAGLDGKNLSVALKADSQGHVHLQDRQSIAIYDGHKGAIWTAPSVRELFRGDKPPPADISHYPPEYVPYFFFVENHLLTYGDAIGDPSDQEFEEVYSMLRRRPDGKSLGVLHNFVWQIAAALLGTHLLSAAEFDGIFGTLTASARKWGIRPISRNYMAYLRQNFGSARAKS
jgi:hypothetical protein